MGLVCQVERLTNSVKEGQQPVKKNVLAFRRCTSCTVINNFVETVNFFAYCYFDLFLMIYDISLVLRSLFLQQNSLDIVFGIKNECTLKGSTAQN
jgi:hypothetical protein